MSISNASKRRAVSVEPPDTYTAIRILYAEPGLSSKDDIVPLLYPVLSFGGTRVTVSVFDALSRGTEVMTAVLTVKIAANVVTLYKQTLGVLQTCPFPD
ncbi:hypothetical protein TNCV_3880761 [Trichonephila clavipes]|nr:hypothetical protein TNCV_3880761 [Trichonephila clavipes]